MDYYLEPVCGVVNSAFPVKNISSAESLEPGTAYTMAVSWFTYSESDIDIIRRLLPPGSGFEAMDDRVWTSPGGSVKVYRVIPQVD